MRNWKINIVFLFLLLIGAVIIYRLAYLQIVHHDLYRALAQGQQGLYKPVKGERGRIFFSGGQMAGINVKTKQIFIYPQDIKNKDSVSESISFILGQDKESILEKISRDTLIEKISNSMSEEQERKIKEMGLDGIHITDNLLRGYPLGSIASKVIGCVGGEESGQYGIEGFYDKDLQGKEEVKGFFKNSSWADGKDIYLTIDYNIQYMAELLLKKSQENLSSEGGQIIIIEPSTGKVLAMAEFPAFDANYYGKVEKLEDFQNSSVQKLYEPGSTMKPLTLASAIDSGSISPETKFNDPGFVKIGDRTIENFGKRVFGERTMTEVLEMSINTGAVFAERQTGHDSFFDYLSRFGFFEKTGIDLQGESYSENKKLRTGSDIDFATASFGQGIEITPIQLVRAFSAIANEGKTARPYVAWKVGEEEIKPEISGQIISPGTASKVSAMMVSVVENGFSKSVKIDGYYIAGKTGTAQVPWSALGVDKKGYSDKTWQSFIGFFPAFDPKILMLVKLDNPETSTAEYSAAPVFKEMAKYIIDYYSIPPDY